MSSRYISSDHRDIVVDNSQKEWDYYELQDLCDKITDGSHYSPLIGGDDDYKIATVANMNYSKFNLESCKSISKVEYEQLVKNGCKPNIGDVLFSKDGTIGLSFVFRQDTKLVLLSSIAIISPKKTILDPDFCSFVLKSSRILGKINDSKTGSAVKRIVLRDLKKVIIPSPPLPEQRKIAAILSSVDASIEQTDAIIAQTERLKKGLMQELFNKDITAGSLPDGWKIYRLSEVCEKIQDGSHFSPKNLYESPGAGRYLYITSKNIKDHGVDLSDVSYIDSSFHNDAYRRCNPKKGDILLVKDGVMTGIATINNIDEEFSLLSSVAQLRPNKLYLNSYYLKHFLNSPIGLKTITSGMIGSAIKRIILKKIKSTIIPVPPLSDQQITADVLSIMDEKIKLDRAYRKQLNDVKKGLMQELLTGRVRVKVDEHA